LSSSAAQSGKAQRDRNVRGTSERKRENCIEIILPINRKNYAIKTSIMFCRAMRRKKTKRRKKVDPYKR